MPVSGQLSMSGTAFTACWLAVPCPLACTCVRACLLACVHVLPPTLQLLEGSAEVFGAELSLGRKVTVKGQALAIFTWHGCKLLVEGEPDFV